MLAILHGGSGATYFKDSQFETFYEKAKKLKINVGAYWYSCANNYDKGRSEARYMYENCLKSKQFEYPIYIDVENDKWQKNKFGTTEAIRGFCELLEHYGYYVGIYANLNYFKNYIDIEKVKMYDKWLALWKKDLNKPNTIFDFGLWQNSTDGLIEGYQVDTNISYKDYPSIIKNAKLNGYNLEFKDKTIEELAKEVIDGKWKNYPERKKLLEEAGYNYNEVQNKVNEILRRNNQ